MNNYDGKECYYALTSKTISTHIIKLGNPNFLKQVCFFAKGPSMYYVSIVMDFFLNHPPCSDAGTGGARGAPPPPPNI